MSDSTFQQFHLNHDNPSRLSGWLQRETRDNLQLSVLEQGRHRIPTSRFQRALPEFAMRYVTEPVVAFSQYGLQSLVDICKYPIFDLRLRSVDFLATTLHIKGLEERASRVRNGHKTDDVDSMTNRLAEISDYARLSQKNSMCLAVVSDTLSACFKHVFLIRAMPYFPP
jgi:hypothetical protein